MLGFLASVHGMGAAFDRHADAVEAARERAFEATLGPTSQAQALALGLKADATASQIQAAKLAAEVAAMAKPGDGGPPITDDHSKKSGASFLTPTNMLIGGAIVALLVLRK